MPDCGDNSCLYRDRTKPSGMRTNGGCTCDECPACGLAIRPALPHRRKHRAWCSQPGWIPEHHRDPVPSQRAGNTADAAAPTPAAAPCETASASSGGASQGGERP
jgi:hypothetical protein